MTARQSMVLEFALPTDRQALGRLAHSLVMDGGLKDGAEKRFGREISVDGLRMLLDAHFADVTQTALAALPEHVQQKVLGRLYYSGNDGRKRNKAENARAKLLATVEYWQTRVKQQLVTEGKA